MTTIWHVALEPISQRYTFQWFHGINNILEEEIKTRKMDWKVKTIAGDPIPNDTTPGAFLDFGATNFYKATQTAVISQMFVKGIIEPGDKFLVTDIWHFGITAIKYMSELLDIPVEIHAIAHAGAYDPSDILGLKMSRPWPHEQEKAWFHACDYVYFGTDFHRDMFLKNLKIKKQYHKKALRSGQPSSTFAKTCFQNFDYNMRENMIVFPHRLNEDKQPEIFRDLIEHLPSNWTYYITQERDLSKEEYYNVLSQSKISFSCSLHENLGISQMEAALCGSLPANPTRASYNEMYSDTFKYPTEWTTSWEDYQEHRDELISYLTNLMNNYQEIHNTVLRDQAENIMNNYMDCQVMTEKLLTNSK